MANQKMGFSLLLASLTVCAFSCSSQSKSLTERSAVIPQSDGTFLASVTDRSESQAKNRARSEAQRTCSERKQRLKILGSDTRTLNGAMSRGTANIIDATKDAIAQNGGDSSFVRAGDLTDRKVVDLRFECE